MTKQANTKAVTKKEPAFVVPQDVFQFDPEEMEGLQISFDRVKIPAGGSLAFEIPGDDPNSPDLEKEIEGVILDHFPVNAYWIEKGGANNSPDCSSLNGKTGIDKDGQIIDCASCPLNAWGSGENNGKACKNMHRVYIYRSAESGDPFPLELTLPPTSIRPFADYIVKRVLAKGRKSWNVVTKISLTKVTSKSNNTYSQAAFSVAALLPDDQAQHMKKVSESLKQLTRRLAIESDPTISRSDELTEREEQAALQAPTIPEDDLPF